MGQREATEINRSHYFDGYDSSERFTSYWHQIDEISAFGGRLLEIGVGNGTVTSVLRARDFEVTTVDLNAALNPDVVADIRALPFEDNSFDNALAAEVLEHLPWDQIPVAVSELVRVVRHGVVVSVPNADVPFTLQARVPNAFQVVRMSLKGRIPVRHALWALSQRVSWRRDGGVVSHVSSVERLHTDGPPSSDQHYWELGLDGRRREDFVELLESTGLSLVRDFRGPAFPYHHFFVLTRVERPRP
jgi:SAM-dependent methyltransferase